jgi:hypothetical protein
VPVHRYLVGAIVGLLLGGVAWTLTIPTTFPSKAKAKVVGIVDEFGSVLFGSTPGKVEVTNFPPGLGMGTTAQVVTLFDAEIGSPPACTGGTNLPTTVIPTGDAKRLSVHGVGTGSNLALSACYYGTELWSDWTAAETARTPMLDDGGSVLSIVGIPIRPQGIFPIQRNSGGPYLGASGPVLGPYFGCQYVSGCGRVRLVAYLSD